ncbi:MAG: 6-phosphogluconolactonase [Anaerolineae bacterium]|nr:6-phosphogluconolactonase [Anaerolineae bacterium]
MLMVNVFSNIDSLCNDALLYFNQYADDAVNRRGQFLVAVSGGSTPQKLFRSLAQPVYAAKPWWRQTHLFFADERCVAPDDAESNYGQVKRLLLDHLGENQPQVYRMRGELEAQAAAADYAQQLKQFSENNWDWPRFDVIFLGMGTDGHTASLFPGSDPAPAEPVLAAKAFYLNRPAWRVSLTPRVINCARQVIFMVTGADKAEVLSAVINGTGDLLNWPAARVNPQDGAVTWLVDESAAEKLPPDLVNRR